MNESLITIIEKTRIRTCAAINQIIGESGLPAYLMEGIITGILADIREQKLVEMVQATEQVREETEPEEEQIEKPEEVSEDGEH